MPNSFYTPIFFLGRLHHAIQIKVILHRLCYNNMLQSFLEGLTIWWSYRNYWLRSWNPNVFWPHFLKTHHFQKDQWVSLSRHIQELFERFKGCLLQTWDKTSISITTYTFSEWPWSFFPNHQVATCCAYSLTCREMMKKTSWRTLTSIGSWIRINPPGTERDQNMKKFRDFNHLFQQIPLYKPTKKRLIKWQFAY